MLKKINFLLTTLVALFTFTAGGAPKSQTTDTQGLNTSSLGTSSESGDSLYQRALQENGKDILAPPTPAKNSGRNSKQNAKHKNFETTLQPMDAVQSGSLLKLEDTFERKQARNWKWQVGLNLQKFGAQGPYSTTDGSTADMGSVGKTWMPMVALGLRLPLFEDRGFSDQSLLWGFAQQKLDLGIDSTTNNNSLNSMLMAYRGTLGFKYGRSGFYAAGELGRLSYSQSLNSAKINLNRSLDFLGYGIGLNYDLGSSYQILAQWTQRTPLYKTDNRIQASNFDGGFSFQW